MTLYGQRNTSYFVFAAACHLANINSLLQAVRVGVHTPFPPISQSWTLNSGPSLPPVREMLSLSFSVIGGDGEQRICSSPTHTRSLANKKPEKPHPASLFLPWTTMPRLSFDLRNDITLLSVIGLLRPLTSYTDREQSSSSPSYKAATLHKGLLPSPPTPLSFLALFSRSPDRRRQHL